jgi:hypothetical protein
VLLRLGANKYLCRRDIADYIKPDGSSSGAACFEVGECASADSQRSEVYAAHWEEKTGDFTTFGRGAWRKIEFLK